MRFWVLIGMLAFAPLLHAKDNSDKYQMGTYLAAAAVSDGTTTNTINCGSETLGSTVCSGGISANGVTVYRVQVADGVWFLETMRQAGDSDYRRMFNEEPLHLKTEKQNPLDLLANGDKVLFRVETHKKLLGTETDVAIPFADNPSKEAKFVGTFQPAVLAPQPRVQADNVKAMCDAHKLSPELEKQFCVTP